MDWHRITERTEYVSVDESLIGIYHLSGNGVVLIDAGAAEWPEFLDDIISRGLEVKAILCSHLHFDHISTAGLIYEKFKMPSYAFHLEERETEFPTRWFPVTKLYNTEPLIIEGERFEVIFTPGHTKGHLAFVTPDGVCCVGDAFMSAKPLKYAKIPFFEDVDEAITSMEKLRQTEYRAYLLCHEAVIGRDELDGLIDANIEKELLLYRMILDYVTEPMEIEEMVTGFMKHCDIRNKFILEFRGYRFTVKSRVMSLDYAGELKFDGKYVTPIKNS